MAALAIASNLEQALSATPPPPFLSSASDLQAYLQPQLNFLFTARPTAVNLGAATNHLSKVLAEGAQASTDARELTGSLIKEAHKIHDEDLGRNKEMGKHGAEWLRKQVEADGEDASTLNVLTVCNTGSLATSVRHQDSIISATARLTCI